MEALWDSVSPEDWHLPSQEWLTEIQRRSQELDEGSMTVAPWSEVRKRARRKAGLDD
ncbi:MAG: addiction module protein [Planctomycetaceae bacterium]|nr:addiction module protein [Planctomycetaceae bacterium]